MTKYVDAGDIDLDAEDISFEGERLTERRAEQISAETLTAHAGRPSLATGKSPQLVLRVPTETKARLTRLAETQHRKPSVLVREAIEEYLASHEVR